MNGALGEGVLAGLLREIYVSRRTGVLRLESGGVTRSMRFNEGRLTQASSSLPEERLGESLVRGGHIGETDLNQALALGPSHGIALGRALVELGVLERGHAEGLLTTHVRHSVAKAFGLEESHIEALLVDLDNAPIDAKLKPLLEYARVLTLTPTKAPQAGRSATCTTPSSRCASSTS